MTVPALAFGGGTKRKHTLSTRQQAMVRADLCMCPECLAARPERVAIKEARTLALRSRVKSART